MSRRAVVLALVLANAAGFLTGSAPARPAYTSAWAAVDEAQTALEQLDLDRLGPAAIDRVLRTAQEKTLQAYAEELYGFAPEDLVLLDRGMLVVPRGEENLSALEIQSRVAAVRTELDAERLRAEQAVRTAVEARSMQQYVEGVHASLEESYDQAVELSLKNMRDQIKLVTDYYRKFPSIAVACT